jgi:hypothetical protein
LTKASAGVERTNLALWLESRSDYGILETPRSFWSIAVWISVLKSSFGKIEKQGEGL